MGHSQKVFGSYAEFIVGWLKFIYSEKAKIFCEISTIDLSYVVTVKSTVEISQNLWPSQNTLESVIDVGQGISIGPGIFFKKNKRRALNTRRA